MLKLADNLGEDRRLAGASDGFEVPDERDRGPVSCGGRRRRRPGPTRSVASTELAGGLLLKVEELDVALMLDPAVDLVLAFTGGGAAARISSGIWQK